MSRIFRVVPNLKKDLVAWWEGQFNGNDSYGTNHLTCNGTASYGLGKVGQAFAMSASTNWWYIESNSNIETGNFDWTWCAWVWPVNNTTAMFPFGKYKYTATTEGEWTVALYGNTSPKKIGLTIWKPDLSDYAEVTKDFTYPGTNWTFLRFGFDVTQNKSFININESGIVYSAALTFTPGPAVNSRLSLGNPTNGAKLSGRVDSVGMWKRLLTDAEGAFLYKSGAGRAYAELQ